MGWLWWRWTSGNLGLTFFISPLYLGLLHKKLEIRELGAQLLHDRCTTAAQLISNLRWRSETERRPLPWGCFAGSGDASGQKTASKKRVGFRRTYLEDFELEETAGRLTPSYTAASD